MDHLLVLYLKTQCQTSHLAFLLLLSRIFKALHLTSRDMIYLKLIFVKSEIFEIL